MRNLAAAERGEGLGSGIKLLDAANGVCIMRTSRYGENEVEVKR